MSEITYSGLLKIAKTISQADIDKIYKKTEFTRYVQKPLTLGITLGICTFLGSCIHTDDALISIIMGIVIGMSSGLLLYFWIYCTMPDLTPESLIDILLNVPEKERYKFIYYLQVTLNDPPFLDLKNSVKKFIIVLYCVDPHEFLSL